VAVVARPVGHRKGDPVPIIDNGRMNAPPSEPHVPAETSVCLLSRVDDTGRAQVLLGLKKRGFGQGKIVGLGGHLEAGESAGDAAVREVHEESGVVVDPASLMFRGEIAFRFPNRPSWDLNIAIFVTERWTGEPAESEEIAPQWFYAGDLPYDGMWQDARHWLPRVLDGERLVARFTFADDCETLAQTDCRAL